jgi:hypothetical protein
MDEIGCIRGNVLVLTLNLISAHARAASPLDPELDPHFEEAGRLNNVDPLLLKAIAMGESSGRVNQPHAGAMGLMHIMPGTARDYGIVNPYDPVQAIYGGARILHDALTKAEGLKASGRDIDPAEYALKILCRRPERGEMGCEDGELSRLYRRKI